MAAAAAPDALGLLPSLHHAAAAAAAPAPADARPQRPWDGWGLPRGGREPGKGRSRKPTGEGSAAALCWLAAQRRRPSDAAPSGLKRARPECSCARVPPPTPAGLLWQVSAELASLGVSLVAPTREVAYLRAAGLAAQLAGTAAHLVLDLELRRLQASL